MAGFVLLHANLDLDWFTAPTPERAAAVPRNCFKSVVDKPYCSTPQAQGDTTDGVNGVIFGRWTWSSKLTKKWLMNCTFSAPSDRWQGC